MSWKERYYSSHIRAEARWCKSLARVLMRRKERHHRTHLRQRLWYDMRHLRLCENYNPQLRAKAQWHKSLAWMQCLPREKGRGGAHIQAEIWQDPSLEWVFLRLYKRQIRAHAWWGRQVHGMQIRQSNARRPEWRRQDIGYRPDSHAQVYCGI